MKIIHLFFCLISFSVTASAQNNIQRVEFEAKYGSDEYNVTTAGDQGILLYYESDERLSKGRKQWIFTQYDTEFKEIRTTEYVIEDNYILHEYEQTDDAIYLLLADHILGPKKTLIFDNDFQLIVYNLNTGEIKSHTGEMPIRTIITGFKVLNNKVFIAGHDIIGTYKACLKTCLAYLCIPVFFGVLDYNHIPVLMHIDLDNGRSKLERYNLEGSAKIVSLNARKDGLIAIIQHRPDKKNVHTLVQEIDKDGKAGRAEKVKTGNKNILITGKVERLKDEKQLMMGTFSYPLDKQSFWLKFSSGVQGVKQPLYAQGVYISKFKGNQQDWIKYYSFTNFENFFDYLDGSTGERVKKKASKKEMKDKGSDLSYELLVHDIIQKNDEYIMLAEAYYPEYEYYTYYDGNNWRTRRVFVGYRYTHAILAAFNEEGEMLYDHVFPIANILSFNLKERVKVLETENVNSISMVYSWDGAIHMKEIEGRSVVSDKALTKIETGEAGDKVKTNYESEIDYWYDNYFLAYGFQKIKNKEKKGKDRKRKIFYFNKIGYEN